MPKSKQITAKAGPKKKKQSARIRSKKVVERFVVLIGDEGAVFVHIKNGAVVERHFSSAPDALETTALGEIVKRARNVPLIVILDTMDQAYVNQTLPPVSSMSVKKLMTRRLSREFNDNFIKGVLLLGRDKTARKEWQFTMAAVERAGTLGLWLDVVLHWPNPCSAVYLLPMEAVAVVKQLQASAEPAIEGDAWQLLVTYNKVSGLRQVVCHGDRMILTRLGHLTLDSTPATIAGTIEQEVSGTKEYLRRLAADEDQALDVFVLVPEEVRRAIDPTRLNARRVYLMTPHEAGSVLGLSGATQPGDRFGDVTLATAIGQLPKYRLPLRTSELQQFNTLFYTITAQRAVTILLSLALLGLTGQSALNTFHILQQISDLEDLSKRQEKTLQELQEKASKSPENLDKIIGVVSLYNTLKDESYTPEPMLILLSSLLPNEVRVKELTWQIAEGSAAAGAAPAPTADGSAAAASGPQAELIFTVEFPETLADDRKGLQDRMTDVLNTIKAALPGYEVAYTAVPELISDNKPIDINIGKEQKKTEKISKPAARVRIKGTWKPPEKPKTPAVTAPAPGAAAVSPGQPAPQEAPNATP